MLTQLSIENFGLIDNLSLEFCPKLNILSGETGAGKSIIIDGLRFALGERIRTSQIREPEKPCLVEAVFHLPSSPFWQNPLLADLYDPEDQGLIIQRLYFPDGRNKVKINGTALTTAQLKKIGDLLIDFHGPNDHQMLLAQEGHLSLLDKMVDFKDDLIRYENAFREFSGLQEKLKNFSELAQSRERTLDLLRHQIQELGQVPLDEDSYESLAQEHIRINNSQKLNENASMILQMLEDGDMSVSEIIRKCFPLMRHLGQIDESACVLDEALNTLQDHCGQLCGALRDYLERLSFEPKTAQEVIRKYDIYDDIKRKYGPSLDEARAFFIAAREKYDLLLNLEQNDQDLRSEIEAVRERLKTEAARLTAARKKTAGLLKKTIERELRDLGIAHVEFEARISRVEFHRQGQDQAVFFISPNAGEPMKPLAEIVSSGEAARLMLALKKALTKVDPIPVLIFDEIDAQIGGRLGTVTGRKLKELSQNRQVILITHLPQIASFADVHWKVKKKVADGRSATVVEKLDGQERIAELTLMMGAKESNKASRTHAQEMLANARAVS